MNTKQSLTTMLALGAIAVLALGCGTPREKEVRTERVVTTETRAGETRAGDYTRKPGETLYEVPVSSVRAIVGPAEKRCWVERERVTESKPNLGGAVAGAVIGGIIGHQIGSGRGNDVATAGGAIAGGAIGANVSRNRDDVRDVERCETTASVSPEYWDVTYEFRGVQHRVQMTTPPGSTITVNGNGEPRV